MTTRPTYNLVKVGTELPAVEKRAGGANLASLFGEMLNAITNEPGEWFELVEYQTPTTAKGTAKRLGELVGSGGVSIEGSFGFDFESRPKQVGDKTGSALYARATPVPRQA